MASRENAPEVAPLGHQEGLAGLDREPERLRLSGCAGSLRPTRLSLLKWEMQGDSVKMQREQLPIPAESRSISTRWTPFSLT